MKRAMPLLWHALFYLGGVAWPLGLAAAPGDWHSVLPAKEVVQRVLLDSPVASEAAAQRRALQARADAIEAGSAEFSLRLSQHQRRLNELNQRFSEHSTTLERPVRAWGKAGLDRQLAAQTRLVGEIGQADALHEAARLLMQRWFDHLHAQAELHLARAQFALAQTLAQQTLARYRFGDVSQLDADLAQADVLRANAVLAQAQAAWSLTTAALTHHYPALPLPASDAMQVRLPVPDALAAQKTTYLEHNHELRLLRAEAQRLTVLSERVQRDRWPDPTLGVFSARDRDGAERVQGVSLSLPFPGDARRAQAQAAREDALAAHSRLQRAHAHWSAHFDAQLASITAGLSGAHQLQLAAETQTDAARKAAKAYAMAELSMAELIQIQRHANEQQRDAARTRLHALLTWSLLQLDLHVLWDWDD